MREDAFFQISKEVRYVALYLDGQLTLRERPGQRFSVGIRQVRGIDCEPRGPDLGTTAGEY
jgi:hypothetical protein